MARTLVEETRSLMDKYNKALNNALEPYRKKCKSDKDFSERMVSQENWTLSDKRSTLYLFDGTPVIEVVMSMETSKIEWTINPM